MRQSEAVDIRVWTESTDGQPLYDVCYQLVGYSNIGCDENRDGNVYFEAIPYGEYELVATNQAENGYNIHPIGIVVDASNTDFMVVVDTSPIQPDEPETADVLLLTRDPETGESVTDVCFELVDYSNIGCDENNDGRVSFEDIPYSSLYVIRQTRAPEGYPVMDDVYVNLMPLDINGPRTILLSQSKVQAPENHLNISVTFYESGTNSLIANPENCAQLRYMNQNASNVGCDEDIVDGQIDFLHVELDPDDASFRLRADTICGYDIVQKAELERLWVSDEYLMFFVELRPNGESCS